MARKDLLKDLMSAGNAPTGDRVAAPRMTKGAIGAVSQSIADLQARALTDVPADLIDDAGISDRLDDDQDGIAALAESIRVYGQQVPVLLRHSPNTEGRYEVVYGRRRVRALRRLGLPVRAMLRDLSDRDLILAQGQENTARKELSFIEKATFARQMAALGFERKVICDALHMDKTLLSRMLSVADAVPERLVRAIGAAPSAGRDRWLALVRRAEGRPLNDLVALARGDTSDARFLAVFDALAQPRKPPAPSTLIGAGGVALGRVKRGKGRAVLDLSGEGAEFADWLMQNIEELHRDWRIRHRDEGEQKSNTNTGGTQGHD